MQVQDLSLELVQELLDLYFQFEHERQAAYSKQVMLAITGKPTPPDEEMLRVQKDCSRYFAKVIALHIVNGDPSGELVTDEDIKAMVPEIISRYCPNATEEEFELVQQAALAVSKNIAMSCGLTCDGHGGVFNYQSWIGAVLGVATSSGLTPQDVVRVEECRDAIMRQLMTRGQYEQHAKRVLCDWFDARQMMDGMVMPMISLLRTVDKDAAISTQEVEARLLPLLTEALDKARPVVVKLVAQEVARIYDVH
jgi:hypothetical protein